MKNKFSQIGIFLRIIVCNDELNVYSFRSGWQRSVVHLNRQPAVQLIVKFYDKNCKRPISSYLYCNASVHSNLALLILSEDGPAIENRNRFRINDDCLFSIFVCRLYLQTVIIPQSVCVEVGCDSLERSLLRSVKMYSCNCIVYNQLNKAVRTVALMWIRLLFVGGADDRNCDHSR